MLASNLVLHHEMLDVEDEGWRLGEVCVCVCGGGGGVWEKGHGLEVGGPER